MDAGGGGGSCIHAMAEADILLLYVLLLVVFATSISHRHPLVLFGNDKVRCSHTHTLFSRISGRKKNIYLFFAFVLYIVQTPGGGRWKNVNIAGGWVGRVEARGR